MNHKLGQDRENRRCPRGHTYPDVHKVIILRLARRRCRQDRGRDTDLRCRCQSLSGALQVRDLRVDDLLVALAPLYESKSLAPGRTLDRLAPFVKGGGGSDPGIWYTYSRLEQGHEEDRVFTHAVGETYSARAADSNFSPCW